MRAFDIAGNGENAADWEIEPQLSDPADDYNEHHHFAPPLSARITTRGLKLGMGEPGWARKAKFYELFSVRLLTLHTLLSNKVLRLIVVIRFLFFLESCRFPIK